MTPSLVRTVSSLCAAAIGLTFLASGCSVLEDKGMKPAPVPEKQGLRPNGVAHMTPQRAMAVARKAMNQLHDAVYESDLDLELAGERRHFKVVETLAPEGCAREASNPTYGRTWVRVKGRTLWLMTDDRAAETMGRTPAQVEIFRGRWLKLTAPALLRDCDLTYLIPPPEVDDLVKGGKTTKVGHRAGRTFTVSGGGVSMELVVATKGPPVVLSATVRTGAGLLPDLPADLSYDGTAVLRDVNTGADVEAPPERRVIDPSLLVTDSA